MLWGELIDRLLADPADEQAAAAAREFVESGECTPGQQRAFELARERVDVLNALEDGPRRVREALELSSRHDIPPAPGEWNAHQVVLHLADNEAVNAVRFRAVLTEDEPELYGYDSDDWTVFYELEDVETALVRWETQRANTVKLLRSLSEAEIGRRGVISYRGPESVRVLAAVLAGHDRDHVGQIEDALRSAESASDAVL